jgi:ribose 5-phosphate isomerase A
VNGELFVSDNGNYILNCQVPVLQNPLETEQTLRAIPRVVGTGLFLDMADIVLLQYENEIQVRKRGDT